MKAMYALGRLKTGQMNKTEAAYAQHLGLLQHAGEIVWHKFEGMKLRLADNTFYTPDFAVMAADGVMECHEVKGFWQDDARAKIKALMGKAFSFTETKVTSRFEIGSYLFDPVAQTLLHAGVRQELSHRESEILKRLCENRNQVVNTQDVLLELWGDDSFFNSRSLHVFITKLRHKLSQDEQIRIVNVRGIGYKLIAS